MKQLLIKISFLFVTMSVLTSSKEDSSIRTSNKAVDNTHTCLQSANDYAVNISCKKNAVVQAKKVEDLVPPVEDNEISLSPISRFILLQ